MIKEYKNVGAFLPSSKYLANKITDNISTRNKKNINILEVGAGTGVFTKKLIENLNSDDKLVVIEINEKFCKILKENIENWKKIKDECPEIIIYEGSILDYLCDDKFDFIISSVPFNNFNYEFVKEFFVKYKKLLKEGGELSFFEYLGFSFLKMFKNKKGFYHIKKEMKFKDYSNTDIVWLNFPPAKVVNLKRNHI